MNSMENFNDNDLEAADRKALWKTFIAGMLTILLITLLMFL